LADAVSKLVACAVEGLSLEALLSLKVGKRKSVTLLMNTSRSTGLMI
jgi:hypothetical protein